MTIVVEKRVLVDPPLIGLRDQVGRVAAVVVGRAEAPPTLAVLFILFRVLWAFVLHWRRLLFLLLIPVVELFLDVFVGFVRVDLQLPLLAHD